MSHEFGFFGTVAKDKGAYGACETRNDPLNVEILKRGLPINSTRRARKSYVFSLITINLNHYLASAFLHHLTNHSATMRTDFAINFVAIATAAASATSKCPMVFDGRVPANFTLEQFDVKNNIFDPSFVVGANQTFSSVLRFVNRGHLRSLYDRAGVTKPVEVTINDKSIFAPSASNVQVGFRRTELMIASNSGKDDSTTGIKTLHFSIAKDPSRPLNLDYEYQLSWLEDSSFSMNQFVLKTGNITGVNTVHPDSLTLFGNTNKFGDVLFTTPFTAGTFHNFALKLDFTRK